MDFAFFKEFLEIDSTTGKEREVADWLLRRLDAPHKEAMEVGDGTLNLFLSWGKPKLVFCSHMDTVPPYISPHIPEEIAGQAGNDERQAGNDKRHARPDRASQIIFGRGSCDAKGQIFALYTACKELEAKGYTDFGLLLLSGEETGSWGAKAFAKTGFEAPFLIVGEPTENKMVSASKGTKSYDLKFTGQAFHSGYPQYGVSAVDLFNEFYNKLKARDFGLDLVLGETSWNIGLLHSDNPQNILSPELTCRLYFRTTFVSDQAVQEWMEEIAGQAGNDGGQAGKISVHARGGDEPARYVTLPGFESAPASFGTDAPHLTGFGHKIICGPGSIRHAHRDDEQVTVAELETAVEQYMRMYQALT
ncbi:MAG: M20/M25/M40 family metallo-hydrolase [Bacteroidales bacterium]|nr:M20/M25/M40 family metallo-hydrolase [Bacteroidales bacterium]